MGRVRSVEKPLKQHIINDHHAKKYRKRHLGLLLACLIIFAVLLGVLIHYRDRVIAGFTSSSSFVGDLFGQQTSYAVKVNSTAGFSLSYDQREFYASAVENSTGNLYLGTELSTPRDYSVVRIAPQFDTKETSVSGSALTLTVHPSPTPETIQPQALIDGGLDINLLTKRSTSQTFIGGKEFTRIVWEGKGIDTVSPSLRPTFVTYEGTVNSQVVTIVMSLGVGETNVTIFDNVLNQISFEQASALITQPSGEVAARYQQSRDLLDVLLGAELASAATARAAVPESEKIAALYAPAVTKIYHAYCMNVEVDSRPYISTSCKASSGSGFIVSVDGYIATNGHVAAMSPKEIAILDAVSYYVGRGDSRYLSYLLSLTDFKAADIPAGANATQQIALLVDALYEIEDDRFTSSKNADNILVNLGSKEINATKLLQATAEFKTYSEENIVAATLVGSDYRLVDGIDGFRASDVALLKIEGEHFPITKLGSINSVQQGGNLSILGYPGNASDNGIVESDDAVATLTTGKVSAKKNVDGSKNKLIETDATIGHGNSGGPAFDDNGEVVGIATYSIDAVGFGDGTYNYIRDIQDFKDLVMDEGVTLDTDSKTQALWEKGIDDFYTSHYSRALVSFNEVLELYPNHSNAKEFIAAAEKRIANGEDVVDLPIIPLVIGAVIFLAGILFAVYKILHHLRHHDIYKTGLAQGAIQPGVPIQVVTVNQSAPLIEQVSPVPPPQTPKEPSKPNDNFTLTGRPKQ